MTPTLTQILTTAVLADQSAGLIRAEVRAQEQREKLYAGVRDAVCKLGCSVDEVSAATGLTPEVIKSVIDAEPAVSDELAALAGIV